MMLEEEKVTSEEVVSEVIEQPTLVTDNNPGDKPKKEKKKKSKLRIILEWVFTGLFSALFVFVAVGQVMGMIDKEKNFNHTFTYNFGSFVIQTESMVNNDDPADSYPKNIAIITHKDDPKDLYESYLKGEVLDLTFFDGYSGPIDTPTTTVENVKYRTSATGFVITHRLFEVQYHPEVEVGEGRYIFIVAGINKEMAEGMGAWGQYQAFTEKYLLGVVKVKSNFLGGFFGFISSPWGLLVFLLVPAFYLVITSVLDIFKAIKEPDEENPSSGDNSSGGSSNNNSSLEGLSDEDKERLKREMLEEMMNRGGKK